MDCNSLAARLSCEPRPGEADDIHLLLVSRQCASQIVRTRMPGPCHPPVGHPRQPCPGCYRRAPSLPCRPPDLWGAFASSNLLRLQSPALLALKLLQPKTTPTMFLPMSWTSPFTVAWPGPDARRSAQEELDDGCPESVLNNAVYANEMTALNIDFNFLPLHICI